jgi:hypothetical protein
MATETLCFKDYVKCIDDKTLSKTRKKLNKKSSTTRVYGLDHSGGTPDVSSISESILCELLVGNSSAYTASVLATVPNQHGEEEEEKTVQQRNRATIPVSGGNKKGSKIDGARQMFQALINRPDSTRKSIIAAFEQSINVTHSTAVSYYERIAKESGITGQGDQMNLGNDVGTGDEMTTDGPVSNLPADTELEIDDDLEMDQEDRTGVIRTVKNAHLIYKQQSETGSFDELWIYNISKENDEMDIRRDILAGTDIPPKKSKSPDGSQTFTVTTMGNAQYLHLKGLTN